MEELKDYITRIKDFESLNSAQKISYFAYFILTIIKQESFTSKDIDNCFKELHITPYSNVSGFLSKKSTEKPKLFIKQKVGYTIERGYFLKIKDSLGELSPILRPSDLLFPIEILDDTRDYLKKIGIQASCCYDYGLYDASLVMLRKLIESLIIELFVKHEIGDNIKNPKTNNFYFLSDLIDLVMKESKWNLSRNIQSSLPKIKQKGDWSAHNRYFIAKKPDLDDIKLDIRVTIQELVLQIDFKDVNNSKKR